MDEAGRIAPFAVRILDDVFAWDAIRADWDRLHAVSPTASTPLDFVWLRSWWDIFGPVYGNGGLRIITLWRGATLVGALPLYVQKLGLVRCLRFVSTGEDEAEETCPDYLNLLHMPGEAAACAEHVWHTVAAMRWDLLECPDLPADSPLLHADHALSRRLSLRVISRGKCPIANLSSGLEAYLKQLSANTRSRARREMRKARAAGVTFEIIGDRARQSQCFEDLVRLHQARWEAEGRPGCFAAARFTSFHRRLLDEWADSGRLLLAQLAYKGQVYVVLYGFVTAGKFDLYQLGVGALDESGVSSPGMATNLLLMDQLAAQGIERYDFLRGASRYKTSLATEQRDLVTLQGRRFRLRVLLYDAGRFMARALRKVSRMMRHR